VSAPLDALERAPHEHPREGPWHHHSQHERIAGASGAHPLTGDGAPELVFDVDEIGKLGHAVSLAFGAAAVQTAIMPLWAIVLVSIAVIGSVGMLVNAVRQLLRRRRNLKHWENGEPLEGVGDWD
jgi:hypothetical protein